MKDPGKRMSADDACAHPWITKLRPKTTPPSEGGEEPVVRGRALREGQDTEAPLPPVDGESNPLDPELVRRLRKFAVSTFFVPSSKGEEGKKEGKKDWKRKLECVHVPVSVFIFLANVGAKGLWRNFSCATFLLQQF